MKVLGIIVEYNPFHNGHILHIQKSKELIKPDVTIAVMSSSFVQRGEPAIIDKWQRSQLALEYGVDLVIELPFVYACQSADYFSKGSIKLLNEIGVTDLCFGSECGDINEFIEIAKAIKEHNGKYNTYVKEAMKQGMRYPNACNQALIKILKKEVRTPNDLLGLSYVKEIIFNDYNIIPHCILRTNDYHNESLSPISSASAIRKAITSHLDYTIALPHSEYYQNDIYCLESFFPYLKYQLLTSSVDELKQYHMVDEGIENLLIQNITKSNNMDDYIQSLLSKRYTKPRIQRMLIHILMKNTKEDIIEAMDLDFIRILAMNENGREYLNKVKKKLSFHLITNFTKHHHKALDIELKATKLLSIISHTNIIDKEFSSIPYTPKKKL